MTFECTGKGSVPALCLLDAGRRLAGIGIQVMSARRGLRPGLMIGLVRWRHRPVPGSVRAGQVLAADLDHGRRDDRRQGQDAGGSASGLPSKST